MDKTTKRLSASTFVAALLLAGCATLAPEEATTWNIPPVGSSWQISRTNTGSYGKDEEVQITRGAGTWQGNNVVTMTLANGTSVLALPNGKWVAIVTREGKPLITYDPPLGYEYPLKVGKAWTTRHRITNHATSRVVDFDYKCVVEKVERITVRAGTFDTFKVVCENEFSRDISWSSHATGLNVRMENTRKPGNPSGAGTQRAETAMINLAK